MEGLDLFSCDAEECRSVVSALQELSCCPRCILRFLGETRPAPYRKSAQDLCNLLLPYHKATEETVCPVCLGILQKYADSTFLNKMLQKVTDENYQFSNYQCSLILPVCLAIRQRSLFIHLKNKVGSMYTLQESRMASVKDVWKWACGCRVGELLDAEFKNKSDFDILLTFDYKASNKECSFLLQSHPDVFRNRKQRKFGFETFTRANVGKALEEMDDDKLKQLTSCPPTAAAGECVCEITCSHSPVFIAGRYQKYSRELSQTPWLVDGERVMAGSVEELICGPVHELFRPSEHRLSSSGREDVDVRMLGRGRPFVLELINPHCVRLSQAEIEALQKKINDSTKDVQVCDLQIVSREDTSVLKDGEINKTKSYSAECWCERPITEQDLKKLDAVKDLVLQQKTPLRVLHRRTAATRERTIHSLAAHMLGKRNHFKLDLCTQAGTYIKEFVHGDFGRTKPNLSELLDAECDIINLDVESVNVDWPPMLDVEMDPALQDAGVDRIQEEAVAH